VKTKEKEEQTSPVLVQGKGGSVEEGTKGTWIESKEKAFDNRWL